LEADFRINYAENFILYLIKNKTSVNYQLHFVNNALFQASARMLMRSELFWVITKRRMVILYRRFGQPVGAIFKGQAAQEGAELTILRWVKYLKTADLRKLCL